MLYNALNGFALTSFKRAQIMPNVVMQRICVRLCSVVRIFRRARSVCDKHKSENEVFSNFVLFCFVEYEDKHIKMDGCDNTQSIRGPLFGFADDVAADTFKNLLS